MRGIKIYPEEVATDTAESLFETLAKLGFSAAFYVTKHYDGRVFYGSRRAEVVRDSLSVVCNAASRLGLTVHAWFCLFPEGYKGRLSQRGPSRFILEHPDCASVDREGFSTLERPVFCDYGFENYACPTNPEVQQYLLELLRELVSGYPLTGVHLDFVRYALPGDYCYCPVCKDAFERASGEDLVKASLLSPSLVSNWRADVITRFVESIYDTTKALRPETSVSALVWKHGDSKTMPDCTGKNQMWKDWALDFVNPMFYHKSYQRPMRWIGEEVARNITWSSGKLPIVAGIGGPHTQYFGRGEWLTAERLALSAGATGTLYEHYDLMGVLDILGSPTNWKSCWRAARWYTFLLASQTYRLLRWLAPGPLRKKAKALVRVVRE